VSVNVPNDPGQNML